MTQLDLCARFRREFRKMPTLTLAKLIYKHHPKKFMSVEAARRCLLTIEGKGSKRDRARMVKKYPDLIKTEARPRNPFEDLPKSDRKDRTPVAVEGKHILFLSDIHFPYHHEQALTTALHYGLERGADSIFLNGDILDCYQLSAFEKDPRKRSFSHELEQVRDFLSILRREFPKTHIYYKEGNHEERYWRYMKIKAPELIGIEAFSLPELLKLSDHNIQFIPGRTKASIGALSVFHGHEFGQSTFSPVNVARGLYLRAKANAICGHSHQTSEHSERDVNDKMITTWSVGCLSELSPDYAPYNKWNHGFAFITREGDDQFHVDNRRIYQGRVM